MSKMSNLDLLLKEIDEHASALINATKDLRAMFSSPEPDEEDGLTNTYETDESLEAKKEYEKNHPVKEEPKITLEDVRARLAQLSRDGKTAQVKALIQKYGANKLSEVNPDEYEALLLDAEVI
ncbi:MAG: hypothetical protein GX915_04685 [Clostridiales bacterium]|nr:hypothetical protein [Clostridiales bacterium]